MILSLIFLFLTAVSTEEISTSYKSVGTCNNRTEYFNKEAQKCCSRCKPGTRSWKQCTSVEDTVCLPCPSGQYSDKMNHYQNCFSCRKCTESKGLLYERNCSSVTDAVCVCKPGHFCLRGTFPSQCTECKLYKNCKPGEGLIKRGTNTTNVQCGPCPEGTFSNTSDTEPCKPHTRCEGVWVLRPGSSTADTQCGMTPTFLHQTTHIPKHPKPLPGEVQGKTQTPAHIVAYLSPLTIMTSSTAKSQTSVEPTPKPYPMTFIYIVMLGIGVVVLVILVTVTVMVKISKRRYRKGSVKVAKADSPKVEPSPLDSVTPEQVCLLPGNRCQKEPSMTSSDSQSQQDSTNGHSSCDCLERTSLEDCSQEPPISSPLVNLSITATINCQLNPTTASCSIPVSPSAPVPEARNSVPLSQEEVSFSCQQEDGKEALQSVQESDSCLF